jgi:hypothetical protein
MRRADDLDPGPDVDLLVREDLATSSSRISAAVPGIEPSPASRSMPM